MVVEGPGSEARASAYDVSIVLPRRIEPPQLVLDTLARIRALSSTLRVEVIIVDDSGLGCDHAYLQPSHGDVVVISNDKNYGKGYSIAAGVRKAAGRYVFYSDIDLPVDIEDLPQAMAALESTSKPAILIGVRVPAAGAPVRSNLLRRITSRTYLRLFNLLLEPTVRDSQCPFKLVERGFAQQLFARLFVRGYAFDAELIHVAGRVGAEVRQYPVTWRDERAPWSAWKTAWVFGRMVYDLLSIRLYWSLHRSDLKHPSSASRRAPALAVASPTSLPDAMTLHREAPSAKRRAEIT